MTYGLKYDPVAKLYIVPFVEPDIRDGFKLKLNSSGLIVHLYCVSYIVLELWKLQVILLEPNKFSFIFIATPLLANITVPWL